ncbi:uncharacterized protein LOC132743939 [Ruditapes philippinarum]|uniref:uncharacterized protein LOC132743939 n=1 Tax=Ruditapes philippinarum TaxID=129788 RepID=UPI00295B8691|nr:uncharacterized protein LOC132743939 [Ruditapes philippinarum]
MESLNNEQTDTMSGSFLQTSIAFFLFTLEWFHIWGHTLILFRVRLLPRKDLVRIRYYFLVDLLTVFSSSILFTGKLRWLAVLQIIQHAYYFVFWEKNWVSRKIVTWSSLDWFKSDLRTRWELDSIIGTTFDIVVHVCMAYYLGQYLDVVEVMVALSIVQVGVLVLLFGPYYAWAAPGKEPAWIEKRIHPEKIKEE